MRETIGKKGLQRFQEIYAEAEDFPSKLTDWERKFLDNMNNRVTEFSEMTFISADQAGVLRKIAEKLGV